MLNKFLSLKDILSNLFKKKSKISTHGINLTEFTNLLIAHGITGDKSFIDKLFWVFDDDSSGEIIYEELAFGMAMFKDSSSMEEKLKIFFEICDVNKTGSISNTQFYDLLKKNIIYPDEKIKLKRISKIIYEKYIINIIAISVLIVFTFANYI